MRARLLSIALILSAPGLTGCVRERPALAIPPTDLLTCADEPVAPALPGREQQASRDALTLDYILGLRAAWGDCRAKIDGIRAGRDC